MGIGDGKKVRSESCILLLPLLGGILGAKEIGGWLLGGSPAKLDCRRPKLGNWQSSARQKAKERAKRKIPEQGEASRNRGKQRKEKRGSKLKG